MNKYQNLLKEYKKEMIAFCIFIIGIFAFSISYAFAAVEPVRSIVITSENTDFASSEEGSWQVTKSGYWTNYGEAEVTLDVDTSLMTNNQYTDIIFVLDISGSMAGEKLDRVKSDSKELIQSLLSNQNNRAALITFDTKSQIISELTNNEELLLNEIDNMQDTGSTNYYQALVNVDSILQDYQKESGREMIVLFLTDGYPNVDTPNQITQYQYLKSAYPDITINGIQYEMGNTILSPIKEISDNQFIADMETLNNILFDASVSPITYDTYQIVDYIDNENFYLESTDDIKVTTGKVELTDENGKQKITWTLDNLKSGFDANLTMKLKLKEEYIGQGGVFSTNERTEVISKIENQEEDIFTTETPILVDNYQVIYDGNAPENCNVSNVPNSDNYSVYSTVEMSDKVPTCEGYEFKGWTITTKDVTRVGKDYFIMPESDVIIKAEWSKVKITKAMNGTVSVGPAPIMKEYYYRDDPDEGEVYSTSDYHSDEYRHMVGSIVTKDNTDIPDSAIESWDVSAAGDGSVIAYIEDDGSGTGTYKVTIGGNKRIIANPNSAGAFAYFPNLLTIDLTYLDTSQVINMGGSGTGTDDYGAVDCGMFALNQFLKTITFGDKWDTSNVTNMHSMFMGCYDLTNLNVSNFNTSRVTDMSHMFEDCSSLMNLDLSRFDTHQVTDMRYMFYECSSLASLDVGTFDTSQVTNMCYMFCGCSSLSSLDVSHFNTSQVTDMSWMFSILGLDSLNLSNLDTSKVTNMDAMFYESYGLTSLDLSSFDTSQVTSMALMFEGCTSLISLNVNNFNTSKVTDMDSLFNSCSSLSSLDLSSFDTSKVTNMEVMFVDCSNLTSLNLSNFDTSQVTRMYAMFSGCSSLTNLDMRNAIFNATSYSSMFSSVPNGIAIIVKDATAKTWIESRLSDASRTGTVTIAGA